MLEIGSVTMFHSQKHFEPGDWVVYTKVKRSTHPGPRAKNIDPDPRGDHYVYTVDKYWIVESVAPCGRLVLRTRTGKTLALRLDDPNLRHANLRERLLCTSRFPEPSHAEAHPSV